jgi:hypothetical protein
MTWEQDNLLNLSGAAFLAVINAISVDEATKWATLIGVVALACYNILKAIKVVVEWKRSRKE